MAASSLEFLAAFTGLFFLAFGITRAFLFCCGNALYPSDTRRAIEIERSVGNLGSVVILLVGSIGLHNFVYQNHFAVQPAESYARGIVYSILVLSFSPVLGFITAAKFFPRR